MNLSTLLRNILSEGKPKPKLHKSSKEGPIRPATKEALKNSIENRWLLFISYEGDEENSPGQRWIEPCVWGTHIQSGNQVLRAWQYKGQTLTPDNFPYWRMFRLDRILSTAPLTNATFSTPRPEYNAHGDKKMSHIIAQVKFGEDHEPPKGPDGIAPVDINSDEIRKTAAIIRGNIHGDHVNFDDIAKKPEFKDSKMRRALDVIRKMLSKFGKGVSRGLQNLHLKEDTDNETR